MDRIFETALLYDFYGELLTPHQRNVYEGVIYNDMSLSEIAEEQGISRQGVHDLIKRCDKILEEYEAKLHLVERFSNAGDKVREISKLCGVDSTETDMQIDPEKKLERIKKLAEEILKEL